MSRLLSHRDDISSSSPPFFLGVSFFRYRSFLIVVSKLRRWSPVTGPSSSVWIQALYPATLQWCNDRATAPSLSHSLSLPSRTRRVNFLQIGILLQFASSSIILAPPRSPRSRPRSRPKLLFMPPLSIPRSSPLVFCWLKVFAVYPGPFKVSIRDKHRFHVRSKVTLNWNFLANRYRVSFAASIPIIEFYQTSAPNSHRENDVRMSSVTYNIQECRENIYSAFPESIHFFITYRECTI